eukprot:6042960-Lingulodinium_polyedra.AAC.1
MQEGLLTAAGQLEALRLALVRHARGAPLRRLDERPVPNIGAAVDMDRCLICLEGIAPEQDPA